MGPKRRWKRKGETKDRQNPRTRARRARTYVARLGSVHVDVVGNDVTIEIRARQVLSRVQRRRRKCRAGTGNDTTRLFVVGHPGQRQFSPVDKSDTAVSSSRRPRWRIRLRARRSSLASMSTHRVATMTRVRRCLEEAKGGLELAWRVDVAAALQRMCERARQQLQRGCREGKAPRARSGLRTPHSRSQSPYLPLSPRAQLRAVLRCRPRGAAPVRSVRTRA